jgi:Holliday junction resolvase RusA-like endonuclease
MIVVQKMTKNFSIPITPMPSPRPRARIVKPKDCPHFVSIYNPPEYMDYKKKLAQMISDLKIPLDEWNTINATFFIPMNKTDRKNSKAVQRKHGTLHEQKPDWDNFVKGLMDALQHKADEKDFFVYTMPIHDDSAISSGIVRKVWINDEVGKIVFSLAKVSLDPLYAMSL